MMHAFLLLVYLGTGDSRQLISDTMYFRSVTDCNFFAAELSRRYGNYGNIDLLHPDDRVTAYCVPKQVDSGKVEVY